MSDLQTQIDAARLALDEQVRNVVAWHFDPATGCPFWLDFARDRLGWNPRDRIGGFDDLSLLPSFEDEWLRGGPVRRWVPKGLAEKPVYVFETGGTTGVPKSRINVDDFRTDYAEVLEDTPGRILPPGIGLAASRAERSATPAPGGRVPCPGSRGDLLFGRSRPGAGLSSCSSGATTRKRSATSSIASTRR